MNWVQVTCQRLQLLAMEQVMRSIVEGTADILGKKYPHYKKEGIRGYISAELHKEYVGYLEDKPLSFFEEAFHRMHENCQIVLSWFQELSLKDWTTLHEQEAREVLQQIGRELSLLGGTFLTPLLLEDLFERKLTSVLSRVPLEKRQECRQRICIPSKTGFSGLMEKELLQLCLQQPMAKELALFADKWGWLNCKLYFGTPYSVEDIQTRLVSAVIAQEKLVALQRQEEEQAREFQHTLKLLQPTPEEKKLISLLQENIYFRTYRLDVTAKIGFYLIPFFKALADLRKITVEDIGLYRIEELIDNSLSTKELNKRKKGWVLTMIGGKINLTTRIVLEETVSLELKEVRGVIAYQGIVQGHAKIILEKKDLGKVNLGDVIIAEMTYPDYNVALAKAAAIVTNIGGVTCHAGIVARELGKPCIIGTTIATKVFKDGDMVEVDATQGMVRKIK